MKKITLLIFIIFCSCSKQKENEYFELTKKNDIELGKPVEGEWLYSHKEKGQSFEQFLNSKHIVPTSESNIIYIRPIGSFNSLQNKQIELLREYLEIYFQLKTKTLETVSNDVIPESSRRIGYENNQQFLAGYILDNVLKKDKPLNRIALMGLTEVDLYPKPEWNFVFGLASYRDKVGVSSIYRLQDGKLTSDNFNLCLSRILKISSHEIGHMFGLHHCITADCVMNGTNSMSETDKSSIRLCSVCQRKLNSGIKYDNKKRLTDLEQYFERNNLIPELQLIKKDIAVIQ
ncbi:archaemetzincin [Flavobacterium sp. W22_SRS_FK3]|uniref:archaemetzincin n=1 Tax=Flavobacterium sp. W22_SRS_FK3 TaxID=3240275 RepID=UPI003F90C234